MNKVLHLLKTGVYFLSVVAPLLDVVKRKRQRKLNKIMYEKYVKEKNMLKKLKDQIQRDMSRDMMDAYNKQKEVFEDTKRKILIGEDEERIDCVECGSDNNRYNSYCRNCGVVLEKLN